MADGTQKYEREIAEILERMDRDEPRAERVKREVRISARQRWQGWRRWTSGLRSVGQGVGATAGWTWIGLTIAAGIAGLFLRGIHPLLGVVCAVAMVLLFFSPLLGRFGRSPEPAPSNLWRGKVVEMRPRGGLLATLRYRWWRFRAGRNGRPRL